MIPDETECKHLWEKYQLPENKRRHCELVADVSVWLADRVSASIHQLINKELLRAAGLVHDIDKNISKLPGEQHPDAGVRILEHEGMGEVADLVKTHPLHLILDERTAPKTWEEKLLFLADKMVKYDIIGVDERFRLWNNEQLPGEASVILKASYEKVKQLERTCCTVCGLTPQMLIDALREEFGEKKYII